MRWLLHGPLTPAVAEAVVRHGHVVTRPDEIGLSADAAPVDVLAAANKHQLDLLTADDAVVRAPFEQAVKFKRAMVFLQLAGQDVEQDDAIDRLFARYRSPSPQRLYTVTETRVKVRQLPGPL